MQLPLRNEIRDIILDVQGDNRAQREHLLAKTLLFARHQWVGID